MQEGGIMALVGKNAIITGSTSGIGLGIAHILAEEGCNIVINGFAEQNIIDNIIKDIKQKYQVDVVYSGADMSKPADISSLIETCNNSFGSVDILVNNAGIQFVAPVEDFPEEKWDAVIAINLSASFHSIKAAMPLMKKRNLGRIINIASAHGLVASANKSAYVAAKHGIVGLTKVIAIESAEYNITCNAICPGWVHTPLVQKQIEANAKAANISIEQASEELLGAKQPKKRFVKPENIGALVAFLCGEHSSSMTGEILSIDGGWTAQ